MSGRHIRDEVATRKRYNLVGNGKELDADPKTRNLCVAFCGVNTHGLGFFFLSIDHAVLSLRNGTAIAPCKHCLKAVREIINAELT